MKKSKQTVRAPLILASASPRRRQLMRELPYPVRVRPSRVEEPLPEPGTEPKAFAKALAVLKAKDTASRIKTGLVLGADTIVVAPNREILGKPTSVADARRILKLLAGAWQTVYTGLALVVAPSGRMWTGVWGTRVKMRAMTDDELNYWSTRNHDKAGAYAAQEKRDPFVERFRGPYDNVVGLPVAGVKVLLAKARKAGYSAY